MVNGRSTWQSRGPCAIHLHNVKPPRAIRSNPATHMISEPDKRTRFRRPPPRGKLDLEKSRDRRTTPHEYLQPPRDLSKIYITSPYLLYKNMILFLMKSFVKWFGCNKWLGLPTGSFITSLRLPRHHSGHSHHLEYLSPPSLHPYPAPHQPQ